MNRGVALLILLVCAMLEAGGDALARKGMHAESQAARLGFYAMAALVLFEVSAASVVVGTILRFAAHPCIAAPRQTASMIPFRISPPER